MTKFHISKNGTPGVCHAGPSRCPLGGEDDHYSSKDDASKAFEASMVEKLIPSGVNKSEIGLRQLNELAKTTSDPEIIKDAMRRGSVRTVRSLIKNPNLESHHLVSLYNDNESPDLRSQLVQHANFPVSKMNPNEFVEVLKKTKMYSEHGRSQKEICRDNSITDDHLRAVYNSLATTKSYNERLILQSSVRDILKNPNNNVTIGESLDIIEEDYSNLESAIMSGRYPADRLPLLTEKKIYWGTISNLKSPLYLDGYARWAVANQNNGQKTQYIAEMIAKNENTSSATLHTLAENGLGLETIYRSPNATERTKAIAANISAEVGRMHKLEELGKQYPDGLKGELVIADNTTQTYANRGHYETSILLNADKVKELGLTKEDVFTLMEYKRYNGGVSYNEETGVFKAVLDSTD